MTRATKAKNGRKTSSPGIPKISGVTTLLVDLDGTLLANEPFPLTLRFFSKAISELKSHGRLRAMKAIRAIFKEFERPSKTETNAARFSRVFAKALGVSPERGRTILAERMIKIFPHLEPHFSPIKGAQEFLAWAGGRYRLVLATNPVWPREIIELRLRWAGVDPRFFEAMTHWDAMFAVKPHAAYYLGILKSQGVTPGECLMIGDRASKDLPATRLGIRTFLLDPESLKKKSPEVRPVKTARGIARAWKGNYPGLKECLE